MAFPTSSTPVATQFATSVTSMAVNLPASISAGDLLIAVVETRYAETWNTIPTGWVELNSQLGGSSVGELTIFYKIADGTEGSTVTWGCSAGTTAVWQVIKITNWHGSAIPEITKASGDYTTNPNPPSLSPSWGAEDTLWIEFAGNTAAAALTTGASTNYTGYQLNSASSGGAQANIASAYRQLNASSEDPGVFANAGNIRYWAAVTIAIRPAAAAGGGDFEIADEASASSIENIDIAQNGGTLEIADESSASSIDEITLQFQGNFEIADEESSSSIDNITIERNGGDFVVNDESSASSIENIALIGNLKIDDANSASSIDNIAIERNGGDFVVEDEVSSSSIENISIQQSGSLLTADIETTSNIENVTLEQNGGTLEIGEIYCATEIDNIGLEGNFIIDGMTCGTVTEEITLEFEVTEFVIDEMVSTSTVENIPLIGEFIIQDINAPPTIENITLGSGGGDLQINGMTSNSSIQNVTIIEDIPENLKTIFIVNRGKVAKWISGNKYLEL